MDENRKFIDFNIDLAQVTNVDDVDKALDLIENVSSVNISCGFHAGTPISIKNAVNHCKHKEKVIGAHIGLPNFVSDATLLSDDDIDAIVLYQLGAISAFAKSESLNVEFVRPHGQMYRLMSENLDFSLKIAKSVKKFSEWFVLYGAYGDILAETSATLNINIAQELSADKPYLKHVKIDYDSTSFIDTGLSLIRLRRLSNLSELELPDNEFAKVEFDTIHFSVNNPNAMQLLSEAKNIFVPRPVNYNKVVESGWV